MKRTAVWKTVNVYAGTLVIGTPAVVCLAAVVTLGSTLLEATIPLMVTFGPLVLWLWYLNSKGGRTGRRIWLMAAVVMAAGTMLAPWWFWSGPLLIVLISEILRVIVGRNRPQPARISR